jgi:hypothetical protein
LYKGGYLGQGTYVDPARDLVIAWFGTGLNYEETINSMLPVSRQIARANWRNVSKPEVSPKNTKKHN